MLPKIVDATLKKEDPQQHETVTKILKQVVQSLHAALESNKDGDIAAIHNHYAQAHDTLRYITLVQEGHRSLDQLCNKDTLKNIVNTAVARTARYAQHAGTHTLPSSCKDICSASCQQKELHCIARQKNSHMNRSQKLVTTCADITRGNIVIASKQYAISPALADAISASTISLPALQHCTGTPLDHVLHQQAVEYMHEALTVMQEFKHPLLQAAYNVVDAAQRGDIQHAYYYLQQCGSLSDLSAINTYIPLDMFLSEHSLIEAATCKALHLVKSLPHVVQGARQSIRASLFATAQTVASPGQWPTKVGDTLHSFGQLVTMTKDVVVDHTLASAALAAPRLCATNMVQKAHQNKLDRYEKALALIEYGLDAASSMTAHEWGELGGTIAADCALGKVSTAATSKLWIASKHLASALKRSETIARAGNKLSDKARALTDRAHNLLYSLKETVAQKPQATTAGVPTQTGMALMEAEQTGAQGGKKIVNTGKKVVQETPKTPPPLSAKKMKEITEFTASIKDLCKKIPESFGNAQKIEELIMELKDLPGAFYCENGEGPVLKLLKSIKDRFDIGNASGALYELEVASFLKARGAVISFGKRLRNAACKKDFDIVTLNELIECKSVNWSQYSSDAIIKIRNKIGEQAMIAKELGKEFTLYSKYEIPESMKNFFNNKNIRFLEGY